MRYTGNYEWAKRTKFLLEVNGVEMWPVGQRWPNWDGMSPASQNKLRVPHLSRFNSLDHLRQLWIMKKQLGWGTHASKYSCHFSARNIIFFYWTSITPKPYHTFQINNFYKKNFVGIQIEFEINFIITAQSLKLKIETSRSVYHFQIKSKKKADAAVDDRIKLIKKLTHLIRADQKLIDWKCYPNYQLIRNGHSPLLDIKIQPSTSEIENFPFSRKL